MPSVFDEHDLIFVSMENWDDIWRRNQFVCAGLSRRYPSLKILFVGLARDFSNSVRRRSFADLRGHHTRPLEEFPNITFTRPLKPTPNSLAPARHLNDLLFRRHVRRTARDLGLKDPILWLNPHSAVHMAGRMGEAACIYDITDDWTSMTESSSTISLIRAQDAELCRRADAVIVCSQRLFELKRSMSDQLHLIPNGVDAEHYRPVLHDTSRLPPELAAWPKPVLGYTGSIHADRIDLDLVVSLANQFSSGTVALVGPLMLYPHDLARLRAAKNIVTPGAVPYAHIPQYMRAFDVSITPRRMTAFTESLNTIKLWEYLAAGKPIVATDIAGFRDYPQFVRIARDATTFADAVRSALAEDPALATARHAEACHHSWDSRLDAIEAVAEAAVCRRGCNSPLAVATT